MKIAHSGYLAAAQAAASSFVACSPGESVDGAAERQDDVSLMGGNVGDPRRANSARPLLQQGFHCPSVRAGADFRPEIKRLRPEDCFALRADAVPVKGELEACVSDVERLAGAEHGDAAIGAIAEGSQDVESHVRNLDALNPRRPLGHKCIVEGSQRVELLPLLDWRGDDRHEVEVALTGVEPTCCKRTEQVQPQQVCPEMTLQRRGELLQGFPAIHRGTVSHLANILPSTWLP